MATFASFLNTLPDPNNPIGEGGQAGGTDGPGFKSIKFFATESEELDFCGCKMSGRPPFCDGTHSWTKF